MTLAAQVIPERFFLGVTLERRPDWATYLMEPEATRSTKADSVAKEIAEKRAKQEAEARTYPVAGTLQAVAILNSAGEPVFTTFHDPNQPAGDVSHRTLVWLAQARVTDPVPVAPAVDCGIRLFGFGIPEFMRLMVLDALYYSRVARVQVDIPLGLWYHKPFEAAPWADPFHMVIPSEHRNKNIDRQGLCDFLGIPCPDDLEEDPQQMANVARLVALKAQLFPAPAGLSEL